MGKFKDSYLRLILIFIIEVLILAFVVLLITSCEINFIMLEKDTNDYQLAQVQFANKVKTKSITGSVALIDADSLYWTVMASKTDSGSKEGECAITYETLGLSDKTLEKWH